MRQILLEQKSKDSLKVFLKDDLLTIRLANQDSFDSGKTSLKPEAKILLGKMGAILATSKGRIRIEGHTDDMPLMFSESFVSNWDLSAARASSVAAALINNSAISQSRLVIAGFADSRPLKENKTPKKKLQNKIILINTFFCVSFTPVTDTDRNNCFENHLYRIWFDPIFLLFLSLFLFRARIK